MFNFLAPKEKLLLLIGPLILVGIILFQGWQANHWRTEAIKEEQLKYQWQQSYTELNQSVAKFAEQQAKLTQAVSELKNQQRQQTQDLTNALKKHQTWADTALPDDIRRLLNAAENP